MDQGSSEQSPEEPDAGGRAEPDVGRRASESEHGLSKITHNALENMGALGHGLKQLFQPQRRRSSVSPHDSASACASAPPSEPADPGSEVGDVPGSLAPSSDSDNPAASAPPAALSRVLQQIRGPPIMKRGTSLQSRRSKTGSSGEAPQKGSPQIHRRSTHEALLQAGRPRSSSTTDTPTSPALLDVLLTSGYHSTEEPDKVSVSVTSGGPVLHTPIHLHSFRRSPELHSSNDDYIYPMLNVFKSSSLKKIFIIIVFVRIQPHIILVPHHNYAIMTVCPSHKHTEMRGCNVGN